MSALCRLSWTETYVGKKGGSCTFYHASCEPNTVWSYISCNELQQRNFSILDKMWFFYEFLKTWKSYFLAVYPCHWSQDRHAQSCDVDSGVCDFNKLDLSPLFYLCKFSFIVHVKCSFPAFWINYQVKFTEVKQARQVKPEDTRSLIYVTAHSKPREDWLEGWTKMEANLNFLKILRKIAFYPNRIFFTEVQWVIYRIR